MIRAITTIILLLTPPLWAQSVSPADADLAEETTKGAESLKRCLGADWTISVSGPTIRIESKFDVYHIFMVSRSLGPPKFSDDDKDEAYKKESIPTTYLIELTYKSPLSKEEFARRRDERQKYADVLNFGAASKSQWGDASAKFRESKVPRYRHGFFDIYRKLPDSPGKQFYPPKAVRAIGGAKEIIDTLFREMRTGVD